MADAIRPLERPRVIAPALVRTFTREGSAWQRLVILYGRCKPDEQTQIKEILEHVREEFHKRLVMINLRMVTKEWRVYSTFEKDTRGLENYLASCVQAAIDDGQDAALLVRDTSYFLKGAITLIVEILRKEEDARLGRAA